jgi:hypothetical protein
MLDFPLRYTPETSPISMANIDMAQFAERANATLTAIVVSGCIGHGIYTGIATDQAFPHTIVIGLPAIRVKVCRQCWKRHGSLKAIAYVAQS